MKNVKNMDAAFEEVRLEEKLAQDHVDYYLFNEKVQGTVHYTLREDPTDPEHVILPFISWASAGAVDVESAIFFRNALDAAIQEALNSASAGHSMEELAEFADYEEEN